MLSCRWIAPQSREKKVGKGNFNFMAGGPLGDFDEDAHGFEDDYEEDEDEDRDV